MEEQNISSPQEKNLPESYVTRAWLQSIAAKKAIPAPLLEQAIADNLRPTPPQWKSFGELIFLALGVASLLCGLIFFGAYNWDSLHKFAKLGILLSFIIVLSVNILRSKELNISTQLQITAVAVVVGVFLAVFGQIYQSGANAYDFFVAWTALITPMVFVSRFPALWLIYLCLINTSIMLFMQQILNYSEDSVGVLLLLLTNSIAVFWWEFAHYKGYWHYNLRWWPRIVIAAVCTFLSVFLIRAMAPYHGGSQEIIFVGTLLCFALYGTAFYIYWNYLHDVFALAALSGSAIVVGTAFVIVKISNDLGGFFGAGFFCIGATVFMVRMLMHYNAKLSNKQAL